MNDLISNKSISIQELLIRMERNNNVIQRLSQKLNSYTCEPTNYSCFERFTNLKHDFKAFTGDQKQLMGLLKTQERLGEGLNTKVQRHLKFFKKLESDVAAYLLDTNKYH